MHFIFWVSKRLKMAGKSRANATGITIAVAGVALALIIMEFTLAIVLGFKNQITQKVMGFDGQISVLPPYDPETSMSAPMLSLDQKLKDIISESVPGSEATLKLNQPGILKTDSDFAGMYFIGYGPEYGYDFENKAITEGSLPQFFNPDDANKIAISAATANSLKLNVGDKVYAYFFVNDAVKSRKFGISGIYDSGFSDYDNTIVFAPLPTLQKIAGIDSISGSQTAIYIKDKDDIEIAAYNLQKDLLDLYQTDEIENLYPVDNVKHTGAMFFNWLQLLDTNVVVIFILMACVAGFTLISSMFILVLDRIPVIGLLRSLGATKSQIRLIFVNLAMKTVGLGLLFGNIVGIGGLILQEKLKIFKLDQEMYYLPYVPVEINWGQMVALNVAVIIVAWIVLLLPSRAAASISPATTIRFE